MYRRPFIVGTTSALIGLTGCTADDSNPPAETQTHTTNPTGTTSETPTTETPSETPFPEPPSCENPERPEPEEGSGNVEPATYPGTPPAPGDTEAMSEYIGAYEVAYRTNALLEEHGSNLEEVQLGRAEPRFFDSPRDSTIARVKYTYGFQTSSAIADSPNIYASYYVDNSVVVRSETRGLLDDEDTLKPNPLEGGAILQCFE